MPRLTLVLHLVVDNSPRGEHLVVEVFDDLEAVGEAFCTGAKVSVELRGDDALARRAIDFMSGLAYGLDGHIERAAERMFLLTPPDAASIASA